MPIGFPTISLEGEDGRREFVAGLGPTDFVVP
jgi:hypothetical protein